MSDPGKSRWLEFSVVADPESVEAVSELFSRVGHNEGVVIEEPYRQDDDGEGFEIDPTRPVTVRTFVPAESDIDSARKTLAEGIWYIRSIGSVGELQEQLHAEEEWADAWKQHFPVLRIGKHLVIRPTWREYDPRPGDLVIDLNPGMAFGTGSHPSTELALVMLEDAQITGKSVLDAGAGSGILSIAAALMGANEVDAVEIDPYAAGALAENIELNGVAAQVTPHTGSIASAVPVGKRYDIVIANIISKVLVENAASLDVSASGDATLILSGIILDKEQRTLEAFQALSWEVTQRRVMGDWVGLTLARSSERQPGDA